MKTESNNPSTPRTEGGHWGGMFRVAIVGAATLKGRELKEVLSDRNFPANDIRLLDDEESLGQLQAVGEEPTFIQSVLPEHLETSTSPSSPPTKPSPAIPGTWLASAGSDIIDLSYALEDRPDALLRAPWVERELGVAAQGRLHRSRRSSSRIPAVDRAGAVAAARAKGRQRSRAPLPRCSSRPPSMAAAAWTSCTSRR